jgi:hypothetical protein
MDKLAESNMCVSLSHSVMLRCSGSCTAFFLKYQVPVTTTINKICANWENFQLTQLLFTIKILR